MPMIGGELGGPRKYKLATSFLFVFLWLFYVLMSSLEAYGYIQGKIDGYPIYQLIVKLPTIKLSNFFFNIEFLIDWVVQFSFHSS